MIEIPLKLQPEDGPKISDGLMWGGDKPVQFYAMTKERDGLIGLERTYLFRPVCYDSANCFEPYRVHGGMERNQTYPVTEFPDTDPIEIVQFVDDEPLIDHTGEYATSGGGLLSYILMRDQGVDIAAELANRIRYEVKYPRETLRLSEIVSVAHRVEDMDLVERMKRFSVREVQEEGDQDPTIDAEGKRFVIRNDYLLLEDKETGVRYHFTKDSTAHKALRTFHLNTSETLKMKPGELSALLDPKNPVASKVRNWFEYGIRADNGSDFLESAFPHLINHDSPLWWMNLNG